MYDPCRGCSGEDCVCCEVYLERRADAQYENSYEAHLDRLDEMYDDDRWDDRWDDEDCPEEDLPEIDYREDWGDWGREAMYEE